MASTRTNNSYVDSDHATTLSHTRTGEELQNHIAIVVLPEASSQSEFELVKASCNKHVRAKRDGIVATSVDDLPLDSSSSMS